MLVTNRAYNRLRPRARERTGQQKLAAASGAWGPKFRHKTTIMYAGIYRPRESFSTPKIFCPLRFDVAYPDVLEHNRRPPHLPSERQTRLSIARRSRNRVVVNPTTTTPRGACAYSKHYPPKNWFIGALSDSLKLMAGWVLRWLSAVRTRLRQRLDLLLEFIALRHQLAVLQRTGTRRPCFRPSERLFWVLLV